MVTKTPEELELMQAEIQAGKLPPDAIKQHFASEEKTVFGVDFQKKKGTPVEQGIGSVGHESRNHFMALRKHEGEDAYRESYDEFVKRDGERAKKLNLPKPQPKAG